MRPGPVRLRAERGVRQLHEEPRGARVLEHGAVQREQDDVGGGDVERDAEQALEAHVRLPDEPLDPVALVGDAERVRDQPAQVRVREEGEADRRQDPPDRAARRLQHEQHGHHAGGHVEPFGCRRAAEQVVGRHRRVPDGDERQQPERPVEHRGPLRRVLGGARAPARAEHEERQQQRDGEERRPVLLRVDRVEDPVDGEQRQPGAEDRHDHRRGARQPAAGALGLELLEQPLLGPRIRGRLDGRGHRSTASRRCTAPPPHSATRRPPATSVRRPVAVAASAIPSKRAGRAGRSVHQPPRRSRAPSIS